MDTAHQNQLTAGRFGATGVTPDRRFPDFFIVGHPKCGTTALYAMLKDHPQIYMPSLKEPWFFASDLRPRFPVPARLPETLDQYLSLFDEARADQLLGEASPSYLTSGMAAAAIAQVQPRARIIAILREPASFLRSLHLELVQSHTESEMDLRKAIALEQARREGRRIPSRCRRPPMLLYSEHVRYVEQLRRYYSLLPREQVLVLIYDDFRRDNEATVREVWRFLGVDDLAQVIATDRNPSARVRGRRLYELAHALSVRRDPASRAVKAVIGRLAPRQLSRERALAIRNRLLLELSAPAG